MSTWELLAELPVEIEDYALEPLQAEVSSEFERKSTVIHLRGAGEEGHRRGRHLRRRRPRHPPGGRSDAPARRALHARLLLRAPRRALAVRSSRPSARSPSATARGHMSRPPSTSRCARPTRRCTPRSARAASRCASSSRCALASPPRGADPPAPGALPGAALQARPDELLGRAPDRRAARHRGGRLGRLQGPLLRLDRRSARRPRALPARRRGLHRGVDRGSEAHARDRRRAGRPPRALLLGRPDPLDRRHPGAALPAAHGQHQALAPGRAAQPARRVRLLRGQRQSATTAAASSSWASDESRSSTSPRCSTPTPPTTSRPPASTCPSPPPACRRARSRRRPRRPASAGADATSVPLLGLRRHSG